MTHHRLCWAPLGVHVSQHSHEAVSLRLGVANESVIRGGVGRDRGRMNWCWMITFLRTSLDLSFYRACAPGVWIGPRPVKAQAEDGLPGQTAIVGATTCKSCVVCQRRSRSYMIYRRRLPLLRVVLGLPHPQHRHFTVLALESSADDTCAAVVTSSGQILSNVVLKQNNVQVRSTLIHSHLDMSTDTNSLAVFIPTELCRLTNKIWSVYPRFRFTRGGR